MKKILVVAILLFSLNLVAQDKIPITEEDYKNKKVEMADHMREDGKIYVLVGIITVIFLGITTYLVMIDRKVAKLEKEAGIMD